MHKIIKFFIFSFLIYTLFVFLWYPNLSKELIYDILELWLTKVLVSLLPFYLLSNLLLQYPFISKLLYPVLKKIFHFENQKSCSLFLISFITGNPTSSILVINSVKKEEISISEGNRLLRCTVLSSPLFTITMTAPYGWYVYLSEIIVSCLFMIFSYSKKGESKDFTKKSKFSIFDLAEQTPSIMLEILASMLVIGLLKLPIVQLLSSFNLGNNIMVQYPLDLIELTTGLNNISKYNIEPLLKVFLSCFLLSFGGVTIIIQVLSQIKKTSLSKTSLIISRILHGFCTMAVLWLLLLIF